MRPLTQISLRAWKQSDAPSVAKYANNENIARNLRDGFPHPYTLKDAENFIAKASTGDPKKQLFAIDLEGEAIGSIGAILGDDIYRINAEIGYWLAEDYWGMGIISEALKQLSLYIFN
ncbi:MAG: N-acetyltransferase, partial [Bacteroidia bacterium]